MSSMQSDTFFRGVKRMKPDPFFRGVKRMKPVPFCPYDYIPSLRDLELLGGAPIKPVRVTDFNRPKLTRFSKLALEWYNQRNNQEERSCVILEFHDLVKSNYWIDHCAPRYVPDSDTPLPPSPTMFYTTFQAKPMGGCSSSLDDIIPFQAKISIDEDKLPVVQECRIRSKQCFDECGKLGALTNEEEEEEPDLFSGLKFHFSGYYDDLSYKRFLQDLVENRGGAVLKSEDEFEVGRDAKLLVVYYHDPPQGCNLDDVPIFLQRLNEAEAGDLTVNIVRHTWILDSFAASKLQPFR